MARGLLSGLIFIPEISCLGYEIPGYPGFLRRKPSFLPAAGRTPVSNGAALIAAAGVGFGHAVLPDHWVPLAVVGRTQHYPLSKVARLSSLAAVAHVLVSVVLGVAVVMVGLQFRSSVEHAQDAIVGSLLIASVLVLAAVTIGTIVALTLFAAAGGYLVEAPWLDSWGNLFTAFVLIAIGVLVLAGVL
jgi:hypothetical protein